jgi:tRNA modification GTPase
MSFHPDDTICAIATASGGAARGMVRVSGPEAINVVATHFRSTNGTKIEDTRWPTAIAGRITARLHDNHLHEIPCDAFVWPTSRSYTREPVAELHSFGSPPLLDAIVAALCRAGARLAEPGEFTLRAFLAGRIDLTQAEAVLGVIDARGHDELTAALAQLAGGLARPLQQLRDDLLQLLAELEAGLDFVEEDIEFVSKESLLARLDAASRLLTGIGHQMSSRSTTTATTQVVLVGAPNAGKSSLFNAIVARCGHVGGSTAIKQSPAIVSSQRGTTRDYLTATIEIGGARCELVDTAGVDAAQRPICHPGPAGQTEADIDRSAQSLAVQRRAAAAIRVCCVEATAVSGDAVGTSRALSDLANCDLVVMTKSDLSSKSQHPSANLNDIEFIATSSRTGEGIVELCRRIQRLLGTEAASQQGQSVASTAERCRESIRLAEAAISRAGEIIGQESGDELAAAELRIALTELGKVVGAIYTDDLLDRIFSTFCIGK